MMSPTYIQATFMLAWLLTKHPLEGKASDDNKHGNMEQTVIGCLFCKSVRVVNGGGPT